MEEGRYQLICERLQRPSETSDSVRNLGDDSVTATKPLSIEAVTNDDDTELHNTDKPLFKLLHRNVDLMEK